jgi:hypothetical protein
VDEHKIKAMEAQWAEMIASSSHKDGIDKNTFTSSIARSMFPKFSREPALLNLLFESLDRTHIGIVSLQDWATMVEWIGSKKGRMRLLYGLCGDKGDPAKMENVMNMLSICWRDQELSEIERQTIREEKDFYTPEKFVRLIKQVFPEFQDFRTRQESIKM